VASGLPLQMNTAAPEQAGNGVMLSGHVRERVVRIDTQLISDVNGQ
jgi:hypothetical protein